MHDERGSVLMLMPVAVLIFLVLGALCVDFGSVFTVKRELSNAAAAAANDAASRQKIKFFSCPSDPHPGFSAAGATYGVAVCPLLELIGRDRRVVARLTGDRWQSAAATVTPSEIAAIFFQLRANRSFQIRPFPLITAREATRPGVENPSTGTQRNSMRR